MLHKDAQIFLINGSVNITFLCASYSATENPFYSHERAFESSNTVERQERRKRFINLKVSNPCTGKSLALSILLVSNNAESLKALKASTFTLVIFGPLIIFPDSVALK